MNAKKVVTFCFHFGHAAALLAFGILAVSGFVMDNGPAGTFWVVAALAALVNWVEGRRGR
jgi:hypothetical protein